MASNLSKIHAWIEARNHQHVVDMTCGNGYDTLFLASICEKVTAVDIQKDAIDSTMARTNAYHNIDFFYGSHALFPFHEKTPINGVIFNLGYLPHGDKTIITQTESTISALNQSLEFVTDFIVVTCYPGHEGGDSETDAVTSWFQPFQRAVTLFKYDTPNSPITYCLDLNMR